MKRFKHILYYLIIFFSAGSIYGATVKGRVTDSQSGEALIGVTVMIEKTSLGVATDMEGDYALLRVPVGEYTIKYSYIGYKTVINSVSITSQNQTITLNVKLELNAVEGREILVRGQAQGQLSAINQQLTSDALMNIVDAARIQELPDQNVAEAISRLPGVTISRSNGEGNGVGIRGLSPQYNQIQIDGVAMGAAPDMGRATDFGDGVGGRGVSLSSVSQENLSGIEVYKAILPDMDAATLGGTVNLRLGTAPNRNVYEAKVYGAYNSYEQDWGNYKLSGKVASRFFDGLFGVQFSVDGERRNRGNDRLSGSIGREDIFGEDGITRISRYKVNSPSVRNLRVVNEKKGFNAIFDFISEDTEILFSNFYSSGNRTTREHNRSTAELIGSRTDSKTYSLANSLRGTHHILNLEVEWQISHNKVETETPDDYQIRWSMEGGNSKALNEADKYEITPEDYIQLMPSDGKWNFARVDKDFGHIKETKYAGKLDLKYPFFIGDISGYFKTGLLVRQSKRSNRLEHRDLFNGRFPSAQGSPLWENYKTDYNPDPILNGNVSINSYFDVDKIKSIWTDVLLDFPPSAYKPLKTDNSSYDLTENFYAGYVMLKLNALNDLLTIIPGFRYEGDDFDAYGYYHFLQNESTLTVNGVYERRNAKRNHSFLLPMLHIKVKPLDWLDTRLAITKTISRPNALYLIPNTSVSYADGTTVRVGNPDLKTAESWNADLSTSIYHGKFGLFTISGFYKEIKNFSYRLDFYVEDAKAAVNYGLNPNDPGFFFYARRDLNIPTNTTGISRVRGIEVDYQANFLFLPGLLKNIVFNINYTRIWSTSQLRKYFVETKFVTLDVPPYFRVDKTFDIGFREGRLPTQPDHILNVSLGYDAGGFSGRVSAFYQGRSLSGVGMVEKSDTYVKGFLRYDMSLRYRFNENISLIMTGVNLTSTPDVSTLSGTEKHSSYAVYGTMFDFGVQIGL